MAFCSNCGAELSNGARFCAGCGTAVDAATVSSAAPASEQFADRSAAPPPPYAGTAQPIVTPSQGGIGWILPLLVVIALGVIGYLLLVPGAKESVTDATQTDAAAPKAEGAGEAAATDTPSAPRMVDQAADAAAAIGRGTGSPTYVTASMLDTAFSADPIGAAARYAGRVRVTGIIASMVQPGPTPALSMEGRNRFNYMIVNFPEGYRTRLIPLAKGQSVSVVCDDIRSLGGTTILSGCLLD